MILSSLIVFTLLLTVQAQSNNSTPWDAVWDIGLLQWANVSATYLQKGYRLSWISGYTSNINIPRYAAIFEKNPGPEQIAKILLLTKPTYENALVDESSSGFRLTLSNVFPVTGIPRFAAIWEKGPLNPEIVEKHNLQ